MPAQLPPIRPNPESLTDQYFRKQLEREKIYRIIFLIVISGGGVFGCVMGVLVIISICLPLLISLSAIGELISYAPSWSDPFINPNFHWPR